MANSITSAVLMSHAPVVIPAVGLSASRACARTTAAMRVAADAMLAYRLDVVVVISPQAPRSTRWVVASDGIAGNFARYRAARVRVSLPGCKPAADAIAQRADGMRVLCDSRPLGPADHGTLVPLSFLKLAGWSGGTVRIALPTSPVLEESRAIGRAIAAAAEECDQRWAVVACGDLSHRLTTGAPAGYHSRAAQFDEILVDAVDSGDYRSAVSIDKELRSVAIEDVVDSLCIAAESVCWQSDRRRLLAYERPFGVGYLTAVLYSRDEIARSSARSRKIPRKAGLGVAPS